MLREDKELCVIFGSLLLGIGLLATIWGLSSYFRTREEEFTKREANKTELKKLELEQEKLKLESRKLLMETK